MRPPSGEFVLCWLHHAVRDHENPAVDGAIELGNRLGLPVVVYQGLGGRHRYNSDRSDTFILEGAREAHAGLAARGLRTLFWLPDDPTSASPLHDLARRAAILVTEDFPAPPMPRWTEAVAGRTGVPTIAIDCACVIPMQSVGARANRAFRFRSAIKDRLDSAVRAPWPAPPSPAHRVPEGFDPGFVATDIAALDDTEIAARVASRAVDHTIAPVRSAPGGAKAGYARWEAFRRDRLGAYHRRRNDAADDGVSALSPYLHHGHVSPMRVARECAAVGGPGPEKFLDELIIWRELAHHFCFHTPERTLHSLDALPDWARRTLEERGEDPRDGLATWETLARGRTGDRVWDLAQRSLIRRGWLHNNLRMTWGKAIPMWTAGPRDALAALIDLNHRFALDGCDPNSYGGILWCLGQFDRPFEPAKPVLGVVRSRDTATHAERLDLARYGDAVSTPPSGGARRVGVIGAGIAGLGCARALHDQGHEVVVFDKGRAPGGRISTRRDDGAHFDHGAQYFTVRDPRFGRCVRSWVEEGVVARWRPRVGIVRAGRIDPAPRPDDAPPMLVGAPAMRSIATHLANDLTVHSGVRIASVERVEGAWRCTDDGGENRLECDALAIAIPPVQAASLVADVPSLRGSVAAPTLAPCWVCMVEFETNPSIEFDALRIEQGPLAWAAREASKPGRAPGNRWTLHASPAWSREHLEDDHETVARSLIDAFGAVANEERRVLRATAHRWRYAQVEQAVGEACVYDPELQIGLAGDWCLEPRIEGAFLSGCALAGRIAGVVVERRTDPTLFDCAPGTDA
ncbi:MAG: NAD(P)-binding protein [Phycisphaerales bacterium]